MQEQQNQPTKQERKIVRHEEKMQQKQQRADKKRLRRKVLWVALFIGTIGIVLAIFGFAAQNPAPSKTTPAPTALTVTNSDWITGNRNSKVVFIEYGDFQCPACGYYYKMVKQLTKEFNTKVEFVFRNFPLSQLHQNAQIAAQAAGAAGIQGKFWEMHDMIYVNQTAWSDQQDAEATFITYAKKLGLNIDQFKTDIDSVQVKNKIKSDYESGIKAKVNYTPTFYINNKKIQNPRTYEAFKTIINKAIAQSNS